MAVAPAAPPPKPQLHMLWPERLVNAPPPVDLAPGYALCVFQDSDLPGYLAVMESAGFVGWTPEKFAQNSGGALPDGIFVIKHLTSGVVVATAMANHRPQPLHRFGGELGWVAASPAHQGKGLGRAVCSNVVRCLLKRHYRRIYLQTDDWRLAAVKTYLGMGFVPFLYADDMLERWRAVCAQLKWPFTPEAWPRVAPKVEERKPA